MKRGRGWLAAFAAAAVLIALWLGFVDEPVFRPFAARQPARRDVAVVLFSGDLGLNVGMGRAVAHRFGAAGIPVTGVDSLAYFSTARDRGEVEDLVEQAVRRALARSPDAKLVVVGQSFGADILPEGLARLPDDLKARVAMAALIVPTRTVYRRISPGEYFELGQPDAQAIDSARRLTWLPVLCVHGREETDSLCPDLKLPNVRTVALPGGHPLRRDADLLFATIRGALADARLT